MLKGSIWVPYTDVTTSLEELRGIKSYRRSKHTWKVGKVPNLAQAAKSELFVAVKGRKRPHHSFTLYSSKAPFGSQIQMLQQA